MTAIPSKPSASWHNPAASPGSSTTRRGTTLRWPSRTIAQPSQQGPYGAGQGAGELAAETDLPVKALSATIEYTAECADGNRTDAFGRDFTGKPALDDALCAVRVTGALFHTQGGLQIDGQARVLRPDGHVIGGLFAGGGSARGVSGARVSGYLSGNGLLTAIALGYLAGQAAGGGAP